MLVIRLLSEVGISTSSVFEERSDAWLVKGGRRNKVISPHGSLGSLRHRSSKDEREIPHSVILAVLCFARTVFLCRRAGNHLLFWGKCG